MLGKTKKEVKAIVKSAFQKVYERYSKRRRRGRFLTNMFNPAHPHAQMYMTYSLHAWDSGPAAMQEEWERHLEYVSKNIVGLPKKTDHYSQRELIKMGIVGIYDQPKKRSESPLYPMSLFHTKEEDVSIFEYCSPSSECEKCNQQDCGMSTCLVDATPIYLHHVYNSIVETINGISIRYVPEMSGGIKFQCICSYTNEILIEFPKLYKAVIWAENNTDFVKKENVPACECGNKEFTASQKCYHTVKVDELGNFVENVDIFEAESPYGPFVCTNCGKSYENLDELKKG